MCVCLFVCLCGRGDDIGINVLVIVVCDVVLIACVVRLRCCAVLLRCCVVLLL